MSDLCKLIWCALIGPFRPRAALQAEILVLRHQLNVLRRKSPKRLAFGNVDRLVFTALYRMAPGVLDALKILKPRTVIRWHRAGFRAYWRWKSRGRGGRPKTPADIRQLIRDMSVANPLWGAPRIHGEVPKLGIDVGQTTVAKYMARSRQPPSQGWKTFLCNHADGIASMDFFVVPTISFRLVYGFLSLLHSYQKYYNEARTHLSLHKDAPIPRAVQTVGRTLAMPVLDNSPSFRQFQFFGHKGSRSGPKGVRCSRCEHRRQEGSFNRPCNSSHPENPAVACLDFLSLRLHRHWISFHELDRGQRPASSLLLHKRME